MQVAHGGSPSESRPKNNFGTGLQKAPASDVAASPQRSRKIPHPQQKSIKNPPKTHIAHRKKHQKSIMFQYFKVFSTFLGVSTFSQGFLGFFRLFPTFFPTFHQPGRGQPHGHAGAQPDAALQLHRRTEAHGEFPPGRRGEAPRR